MTLEASGTLQTVSNIQYLCTLVRRESLHQSDTLSSDVEHSTPLTLEAIIFGLGIYFFPVNALSKQNCAVRRGMSNPRGLKVGYYTANLIGLNK